MDNFNEDMFKTKVDNIFVKFLTAIMKWDLSSVDHFISDEVYEKYNKIIKELKENNQRQVYDELNVKNTSILSKTERDGKLIVKVEIVSRYMDYVIDLDTGNIIKGTDTKRIEKRNILTFERRNDIQKVGLTSKCPGCGANISVNTSGKCEYCGAIFNQEDYDFILTNIDTF